MTIALISPAFFYQTVTMPSLELKTNVKLDNPKEFIQEFSKAGVSWKLRERALTFVACAVLR